MGRPEGSDSTQPHQGLLEVGIDRGEGHGRETLQLPASKKGRRRRKVIIIKLTSIIFPFIWSTVGVHHYLCSNLRKMNHLEYRACMAVELTIA